jgi:hypothetical protein
MNSCKHQAICDVYEARGLSEAQILTANATAWIINWICVMMLFIGLVMLSHSIDALQVSATENWEHARNERYVLKSQINILADALSVSPKDVLPHVIKIEQMLHGKCGVTQ